MSEVAVLPELAPVTWIAIIAIVLVAGFVKGAVGFAMPMIMISGLGSFLSPTQALAALILPAVITNGMQAMRHGLRATGDTIRREWRYMVMVLLMIAISSQLVNLMSDSVLFLMIGVPVVILAAIQLSGLRFTIPPQRRRVAELSIGGIAGFLGGIAGTWGPPTVLYLTALNTPKLEQMRFQGVVYGFAAIVLTISHIKSGVFNAQTAPLSALLLLPAFLGTTVGFYVSDRLNQERFRQITLVVLVVAGLNLVRRGLTG